MNACGVAVARLQGHSWTPTLSNGWKVNVGTIPPVPLMTIIESPHPGVCDFRLVGFLSVGVFWLGLGMSGVDNCRR